MTKRHQTITDFTSCFVVLSQIDNVDLGLDDFLLKYIEYLKEGESSEGFLILKVSDLANLITNLDKVDAVSKKHARLGLKRLLFLKLRILNNFPEKKRIIAPKLSTPRKKVFKPRKIKDTEKDIIDFLGTKDKVRSLDIVNHFRNLHPRSVKRYLSNLTKGGHIQRKVEGKAVFYLKND